MQIGIFAKTFPGVSADQVLEAVARAGYEVAQFNMACVGLPSMPEIIAPATAQDIAKASAATGVKLAALSGTYNMIHPDPKVRADGLARLEILIRVAPLMGTGVVTLCTGTRDANDQWKDHPENSNNEAWRDLLAEMRKAIMLAEENKIALGIEPELANVVSSAKKARQLIDELKSPCLRIVLDPANLFKVASEGERQFIIEQAIDILGNRIIMAHAKDRSSNGGFTAAGQGVIDFPHFITTLRRAGFHGPLVAHGLSEQEAPAVAQFLRKALAA